MPLRQCLHAGGGPMARVALAPQSGVTQSDVAPVSAPIALPLVGLGTQAENAVGTHACV